MDGSGRAPAGASYQRCASHLAGSWAGQAARQLGGPTENFLRPRLSQLSFTVCAHWCKGVFCVAESTEAAAVAVAQ